MTHQGVGELRHTLPELVVSEPQRALDDGGFVGKICAGECQNVPNGTSTAGRVRLGVVDELLVDINKPTP